MKKYLLLSFILSAITVNTFAQKGLFLKPYIGAGIADWGGSPFGKTWAGGKRDIALTGGAELGLSSHRWHKSIGISILRIGTAGELTYFQPGTSLKVTQDYKCRFHHILVPIKLGYEIHAGRLSLMPELGLAPAYLLSSTIKQVNRATGEVSKDELIFAGGRVRKFSLFGIAGINFAYHINDHISVTIAPSYYLMVSNNNTLGGSFLNYGGSDHQYALTANAGLLLKL